MRTALVVLGAIVGLGSVLWSAIMPATGSWRQKLTLVIETPDGEVSGFAVSEVRYVYYDGGEWLNGREVGYGMTGEAVVVEVPPGRYLLALLASEELFAAAAKDRFAGMRRGEWLRAIPGQTEPVALTDDLIPMLVTFDDITKPETVREVDPADLAAVFGEGVRLKAVTLENTEEAVTEGRVEGVLGWMPDYPEAPIIPIVDPMDFSVSATLRQGDFMARNGAL
jgi:hypothetical protein